MGNGKSLAFKIVNGKWVKDEEEAKLGKRSLSYIWNMIA